MTTEWKTLNTLQEVAAAMDAGEEIEVQNSTLAWQVWKPNCWLDNWKFRSRPKPRTKKIVLREALAWTGNSGYWTVWTDKEAGLDEFLGWLDTPAREIEVPDET